MKYQTISLKYCFPAKDNLLSSHSNGDIFTFYNNMLFSCVKILGFCTKADLVFHWCLYNKLICFYFLSTHFVCFLKLGA